MPNKRLENLLKSAARRMSMELDEKLVPHRGELGRARERIVKTFLREHLPKRYEISSGFVFDAAGEVSQQLDVIIADTMLSPRFTTAGGARLYPCESVVAVGQLKSQLTSRRELWAAIDNLRSASGLDRSANGEAVCSATGEQIDYRNNHRHRIFTFVFIVDKALSADLVEEVLLEVLHRSEPHEWPNMVFSLKKYLVTYACDFGVCPNTLDARGISCVEKGHKEQGLLRFYTWLTQAMSVTSVSEMSAQTHLKSLQRLSARTSFSTFCDEGEPPPYLSTLHSMTGMQWKNPYDDDE